MVHSHHTNHEHINRNIGIAFFLNLLFAIIEIIGGFLTNSFAILSDALHDLGDSISLGVSWFLEKLSLKKPDHRYSFGYARFSLLGAIINSLLLIAGSTLILVHAIPRLFNPEEVHPQGMLVLAIIGIAINGIAILLVKRGKSLNAKTIVLHLLEDVLGWIAIFIASIVMIFVDFPILDTILSIVFTLFILYHVFKNLVTVFKVLLQAVPSDISIPELEKHIIDNTNAKSIHHTHVWTLDGLRHLLSTHVVIDKDMPNKNQQELKERIKKIIKKKGIEHVTIEIEFDNDYTKEKECLNENNFPY